MKELMLIAALLVSEAPQAPKPPQAPGQLSCPCGCREDGRCNCTNCPEPHCRPLNTDYVAMRKQSIDTGKPLIVWIGDTCCLACERAMPDCLHCHCASFYAVDGKHILREGIVVGVPEAGELYRVADLPASARTEAIRATLQPKQAQAALLFRGGPICSSGG